MKKTVSAVLAAAMMMVGAQGIVAAAPATVGVDNSQLVLLDEYYDVGDGDVARVTDDGYVAVADEYGNAVVIDPDGGVWVTE